MTEQRKHAILFSATILAARKLRELGDKPCPAREACIEDAIRNAERILQKVDQRWPSAEVRGEACCAEATPSAVFSHALRVAWGMV